MSQTPSSLLKKWTQTAPQKKNQQTLTRDQIVTLDPQTQIRITRPTEQNYSRSQLYLKSANLKPISTPISYPRFRGIRTDPPTDSEEGDFYLLTDSYELVRYHNLEFELIT